MNWGPLWCHSTFSFEAGNHNLLKAIKSSNGVTLQIIRYIQLNHIANVLRDGVYSHVSDIVKIYCDDVLDSRVQNSPKISKITYFGKGDGIDNTMVNNFHLSKDAVAYYKIIKDGCLYESNIKQKRRSNNAFILLNDNRFATIEEFIVDEDTNEEFTICNIIKTRNHVTRQYPKLKVVEEIEANYTIVHTRDIKTICISMNVLKHMYLIPLPNLLHY